MAGTKRRFLEEFLQFSGNKNTHNFVKNDPKFENKSLFDAKFYQSVSMHGMAACKKTKQILHARQFFPRHFDVHICNYNMNLVTVLKYLKCPNSAIYFLGFF